MNWGWGAAVVPGKQPLILSPSPCPPLQFHKKQVRSKGDRGVKKEVGARYDGAALEQSKRGGVIRVPT